MKYKIKRMNVFYKLRSGIGLESSNVMRGYLSMVLVLDIVSSYIMDGKDNWRKDP